MITQKVKEALNKQVNAEFYSAYLYLSMSAYFKNMNLTGFANWMMIQAMEESTHALKFYNFILDRGGKVKLTQIDTPENNWKDIIAVFEATLAHEQLVTGLINNIVDVATKDKDNATLNVLQWFVNEQVEEEANAEGILQQLKLIKGEGHGILLLDREFKARVFVDKTQQTGA